MIFPSLRLRAAVLLLLALAWARGAAAASGIEIAITPFLPVRTLVQHYEPMRLFLEKQLQQPVIFVTAPDYKTFNERILKREYSYLVTVANGAYVAIADAGYVPLLRPVIDTRPTLVVKLDAGIRRTADLRRKTVALSDRLALVSMQAPAMLREAGLDPEHDVALRYHPNHAAAVNYMLSGEADAAIVSDRALMQMAPAVKDATRVVAVWDKGAAPGVVYLASPRLPRASREQFARAVLDFVHTAEGRRVMERLGYGGLRPTKAEELKFLAPYGASLKTLLAQPDMP
jgi:phosphonate transport system substrate-binding protein